MKLSMRLSEESILLQPGTISPYNWRHYLNPALRVPDNELAARLPQFVWTRADALKALHCKENLFCEIVRKDLPYILVTQELREKYSGFFEGKPASFRNGQFLYNPSDIADWLRTKLLSTVSTVLVPLTMFATKPDVMRSHFQRLKQLRVSDAYTAEKSGRRSSGQLCFWPEIKALIKPEYADDVWAYPDDIARLAEEQNRKTDKVRFPVYSVRLPEGIIPKFFTIAEVAATRKSATRSAGVSIVRNFAWARHEYPIGTMNPEADGKGKVLFTQGLFIGRTGPEFEDYDKGLLTIMTVERFVRLFGVSALADAQWRISKDLTTWCGKKGFSFGPGLPGPELSKLLLINKMRRRTVCQKKMAYQI